MDENQLRGIIERAFEARDTISPKTTGEIRAAVEAALDLLDRGEARVAEKRRSGTEWFVNDWLKKAVLLSFRINDNQVLEGCHTRFYDKVPLKYAEYAAQDFERSGTRVVPDALVRYGAYVASDVVLMPCYVNIGAYVDRGTMIDTWATVGSCAQIGKNCHISGGAGIGGVLEPIQAGPVIIEDNCFIGARAEVAEGVVVEEGSVLSMGVYLGASTKIVERATGKVHMGRVPAYSVVVPGGLPDPKGGPTLYCAVIVKRVDEKTRSKTSINELLRD